MLRLYLRVDALHRIRNHRRAQSPLNSNRYQGPCLALPPRPLPTVRHVDGEPPGTFRRGAFPALRSGKPPRQHELVEQGYIRQVLWPPAGELVGAQLREPQRRDLAKDRRGQAPVAPRDTLALVAAIS